MKPEVVLACLTLCLVEAGSSHRRRSLATAPFQDTGRFSLESVSPPLADESTDTNSYWSPRLVSPSIDQSVSFLLQASGSQVPAHDLRQILHRLPHRNHNRSQLLTTILQQAARQFRDSALTSEMTKRQMTSPRRTVDKRRYRCDFTRVSIQMILEYFRTRRVCGYRVNRVRFGLGGK